MMMAAAPRVLWAVCRRQDHRRTGVVVCDAGGRCVATGAIGRRVATRAVGAADAGEEQNANQQDQDGGDDPQYRHPPWCAGVRAQVSHERFLFRTLTMFHG